MQTLVASGREIAVYVLEHLLECIQRTPAQQYPFTHIYLEDVFPADIYRRMLAKLPEPESYGGTAERHHGDAEGSYTRSMCALSTSQLNTLSTDRQELWNGIAAALTAPELKCALFAKLARDLAYRYGIREAEASQLAGHARPTLYRETAGFEIPPHPDTRKKIVTMHFYCPEDRSQLNLGTALYRRKWLPSPFSGWQGRFEKVKQFEFQPNSGYAFVVNNKLTYKSWHGREKLPDDAGVRNTLLNTFYETPRDGFGDYLKAA